MRELGSPFGVLFPAEGDVPQAFRDQYLVPLESPDRVVMEGTAHDVWYRPGWLGPVYRLMGRLGLMVARRGRAIPARMEVHPGWLPDGTGYYAWNRVFDFGEPVHFDTWMGIDPRSGHVVDMVGPGRRLHVVVAGRFQPPNVITMSSVTYGLRIGTRLVWLPRWLWALTFGSVEVLEVARPAEPGVVDVDLRIVHPVFGPMFGYVGTFRARRLSPVREAGEVGPAAGE